MKEFDEEFHEEFDEEFDEEFHEEFDEEFHEEFDEEFHEEFDEEFHEEFHEDPTEIHGDQPNKQDSLDKLLVGLGDRLDDGGSRRPGGRPGGRRVGHERIDGALDLGEAPAAGGLDGGPEVGIRGHAVGGLDELLFERESLVHRGIEIGVHLCYG